MSKSLAAKAKITPKLLTNFLRDFEISPTLLPKSKAL